MGIEGGMLQPKKPVEEKARSGPRAAALGHAIDREFEQSARELSEAERAALTKTLSEKEARATELRQSISRGEATAAEVEDEFVELQEEIKKIKKTLGPLQ